MDFIPNQSSLPRLYTQFTDEGDDTSRMLPAANSSRLVDLMRNLSSYPCEAIRLASGDRERERMEDPPLPPGFPDFPRLDAPVVESLIDSLISSVLVLFRPLLRSATHFCTAYKTCSGRVLETSNPSFQNSSVPHSYFKTVFAARSPGINQSLGWGYKRRRKFVQLSLGTSKTHVPWIADVLDMQEPVLDMSVPPPPPPRPGCHLPEIRWVE